MQGVLAEYLPPAAKPVREPTTFEKILVVVGLEALLWVLGWSVQLGSRVARLTRWIAQAKRARALGRSAEALALERRIAAESKVLRALAEALAAGPTRPPLFNRGTVRTGPGKYPDRRTGEPDGTELWSTKPGKMTSAESARGHFDDHGAEFPELKTEKQYVDVANDFVSSPPDTAEIFVRESGEVMIYDPVTKTCAVRTPEGVPATMHKLKLKGWEKKLATHGGQRTGR